MIPLVTEVSEFAKDILRENPKISLFESLSIAVQIQKNRILTDAFNIHDPKLDIPNSLEAISIALGFERNNDSSIKDAINNLAEDLQSPPKKSIKKEVKN